MPKSGVYYSYNDVPEHKTKMDRVAEAELGSIVAAKFPNGKVKSAMIIRRSSKLKKLLIETSYGRREVIDYEDVIWVKTKNNQQWPKGVLDLMKQTNNQINDQSNLKKDSRRGAYTFGNW